MIAISREHPLASKSCIEIEDLYGETLMMVCRGDSGVNDFIRNDLEKNHPLIHIEDTPQFYDLSVFNRCAETGNVLLTIECWQDKPFFVMQVEQIQPGEKTANTVFLMVCCTVTMLLRMFCGLWRQWKSWGRRYRFHYKLLYKNHSPAAMVSMP